MKRKDKYKAKTAGSIMVSAILAIFVWIGIAQSMAIIANSGFKSIKSGRTAIQAQQYADISIDRLKNINYDELDTAGAHTRAVISGLSTTDWEDEVTIGAESTIAGSDDVKQRIATVNVYKTGDTLPRYTVEVPLSSQSDSAGDSLPKGSIIPYNGPLSDIPKGWHLCDGSNGTPNLTGRFLQGWGWDDFYNRSIGQYIAEGLPNITGIIPVQSQLGYNQISVTGAFNVTGHMYPCHWGASWNNYYCVEFNASRCSWLYGNSATVQPRSYTVYYIIKMI